MVGGGRDGWGRETQHWRKIATYLKEVWIKASKLQRNFLVKNFKYYTSESVKLLNQQIKNLKPPKWKLWKSVSLK